MKAISSRKSWDTAVKHLARHGILDDVLLPSQINLIPSSNISRWKNETDDKYLYCEINKIVSDEIELIRNMNQSSKVKRIISSYFQLCDTFHSVISSVKGIKTVIRKHRDVIINTIENVKEFISIDSALKVFNLSRSSFEHYKNRLIYQCDDSYFNWCVKKHPNQLLSSEVGVIRKYMTHDIYKYWSKSSIYLKAVIDSNLLCGISTFYKYCSLLGFQNKPRRKKSDDYEPVVTSKPNELWCVDVTIFKTKDHVKQYIHLLVDHYSKMILGYQIKSSSSGIAIKELLQDACLKYTPDKVQLLSDGGSENVNTTVSNFTSSNHIKHLIAQKDVVFSNSMIEAINKIIKHQFLHHKEIPDKTRLETIFQETVSIYNTIRPQMSLDGNMPIQTFKGKPIDFSAYSQKFNTQKAIRISQNTKSKCTKCH
ncbi:DDE-type integrase/transposase/recombinase [Tenacibaculum halocynthiae]|uniref:DDE-type integrase/transposase/recombinase n=1 Tax=Tenacibaculum halocynthiae TaxID=1254437 RepID=UPI003D6604E7